MSRRGFKGKSKRHSIISYGADTKVKIPAISLLPTPNPHDIELMSREGFVRASSRSGIIPLLLGYPRVMPLPASIKKAFEDASSIEATDERMRKKARELVRGAKTQREALKRIYVYVAKNMKSIYTLQYLKGNIYRFVPEKANIIWNRRPHIEPCHTQAIVLRAFLLASGRFKPEEVQFRIKWNSNVPHFYLRVYLRDEKTWINADPWVQDYIRGAGKRPEIALGKTA